MKRPLVWVAVALAAGIWSAAMGLMPGVLAPATLGVTGLLVATVRHRRRVTQPLSIALVFFAAGAVLWNARHAGPPGDALSRFAATHPNAAYTLAGRVRRPDLLLPNDDYTQFVLRVKRAAVDGKTIPLSGKTVVRWQYPGAQLYADQEVRIRGTVRLDLGHVNPGVLDVEDHLRRQGVHSAVKLRGQNAVVVAGNARWWSIAYWASRLRFAEAARLRACVPDEVLPFVRTVWLGDRGSMTSDTYAFYVASGTAHILSVSGVHAGILFVSASAALRLVLRRRRLRAILTMGIVFVFALVAGARVATMRAAVMIALYLAADIVGREPDAPTALSVSAILFLLGNPDVLFDVGFQLSFTSVASILIFREPIAAGMLRLPRLLREGLATTLAVQILPLPLAIHRFHVLPLAAPLANLVVVPLLTVSLWLCFMTVLCAFIFPAAALLFGHALLPIIVAIRAVAAFIGGLEGAHLRLVSPTLPAMICYWGGVGALLRAARRPPKRWRAAAVVLFFTTWLWWRPLMPPAEVVFLDVGHGDAAFVRSPGGTTLLIDGGDRNDFVDSGKRLVAPFLWANHVSRLDYVVLTHPDRDHAGGLHYVLDRFDVGALLVGPSTTNHPREAALLDLCKQKGVAVRRLAAGDAVAVDEGVIEVLHPPATWPRSSSTNDASLVLRFRWPGADVLFTGDIEARAEAALGEADLRATVLKAPHHGSNTSSSQAFIVRVRPRHCVISTGLFTGREVASDQVVGRYKGAGAMVWRTDHLGAITCTERGRVPVIYGERPHRGYIHAPLP